MTATTQQLQAIDSILSRLTAVDIILSKAVGVSPSAQMNRIEKKLREYLIAKWNALRSLASKKAASMVRAGATPDEVKSAVQVIMERWGDEVKKQYLDDFERIYRLGRESLWRKATSFGAKPVEKATKPLPFSIRSLFSLKDKKAIAALKEQQLFWISEIDGYQDEIASTIRDTTEKTILEQGMDRIAAGKIIKEKVEEILGVIRTPSGYAGSSESYFEGLAASASTTARSQGQIRTLQQLGVKRYEVVNPEDRRTCEICSEMNGKSFTVDIAGRIADDEISAETPEEVKEAHPFVNFEDIEGLSEQELSDKGIVLPPFHFNCFPGNIKVWSGRGLIPICSVVPGDMVLTHLMRWKKVRAVMSRKYAGEFVKFFEDVEATKDHPFLVNRGKDVIFDSLKEGDFVATVQKSLDEMCKLRKTFPRTPLLDRSIRDKIVAFLPVKNLELFVGNKIVWNLTVEDDESFVIANGIVVHNCRCNVDITEDELFEGDTNEEGEVGAASEEG